MATQTVTRIVGSVVVAATTGAALGAGMASADTIGHEQRHDCPSFASPNFAERYGIFIRVTQTVEPTVGEDVGILVQHGRTYFRTFPVVGTMTWKNEVTGKQGSVPINTSVERRELFQPGSTVMTSGSARPGPGPLVVTVKVKPGSAPEAVCTGRFQTR
ncbi:hypothetical protein TPB0596_20100 [Tsukamurella pulmonis]|uniref:hypothetical protein n=1 Tax=Tsukamurella pulmonis TaxID=47312 RepID=UPI001EDCD406|nr:hypothetical protein [Tsukamurella pulmonis]BDD82247.1 hypothetical protein TPB0596_20100 [Tsukamurella pulmonis]